MKIEHISTLINGIQEFRKITGSTPITMVNFFAPWCHWCQSLAPIYEGVAQRVKNGPLQSVATIAKVDCTNPVNFDVCRLNNIQAYPTIIVYVYCISTSIDIFLMVLINSFIIMVLVQLML